MPSSFPVHGTPASFSTTHQNNALHVILAGNWTVSGLHNIEKGFTPAAFSTHKEVIIDLSHITRFDTAGALIINEMTRLLRSASVAVSLVGSRSEYDSLLHTAVLPPQERLAASPPQFWGTKLLNDLGRFIYHQLATGGQHVGFLGKYCTVLGTQLLHPHKMRWTSLVFHMEQVGLRAVPIVALLTYLIGLVVAYMGSEELARFGAQVFAVNLLEVTIMREMGVLITAIVVAGRSSSSFTAQIGAMVANEEVAAIRSMGLSPMELLVIPRVLALTLMLPVLVFIADIMALLGGATALWYTMDMTLYGFTVQLQSICKFNNFFVGMVKTPFFAVVIGIVGCYQGFKANSSAESVGFLTTASVVQSIFLVIVLDALFAIFFTSLGI